MSLTKTFLVLLLGILVVQGAVSTVQDTANAEILEDNQRATEEAQNLLKMLTGNFFEGLNLEFSRFEQVVSYEPLPQTLQCGDIEPLIDKNTAGLNSLNDYSFNEGIFTGTIDDMLPLLVNISRGSGDRHELAAALYDLLTFAPIPVKSPFIAYLNKALANIFDMIRHEYFVDGAVELIPADHINNAVNTLSKCYIPLLMRIRAGIEQSAQMLYKLNLLFKSATSKLVVKAQECKISIPEQIRRQILLPQKQAFNLIQMQAKTEKHEPDMWDDLFSTENIIQKTEDAVKTDQNMEHFLRVVPSMSNPTAAISKMSENAVQTNVAEDIPAAKSTSDTPTVEMKTTTANVVPAAKVETPIKEASAPTKKEVAPTPATATVKLAPEVTKEAAPVVTEQKAAPVADVKVKKISKLPKKPLKLTTEVKPEVEPTASPKRMEDKSQAPIEEVATGPAPLRQTRKASPTAVAGKKFAVQAEQEPQVMHTKKNRMPMPEMIPRLAKQAKNDTKPAAAAGGNATTNGTTKAADKKEEKKDGKGDAKKDDKKKDDKKKDDKKDKKDDKKDKKEEECTGCGCPNREVHAAPVVHPDESKVNTTEVIGGVTTIARKLKLSKEGTEVLNMMPKIAEKKDPKLPENEVGTPMIADAGPMVPRVPLNYKAQLKVKDDGEVAAVIDHMKRQPMPDLPTNFHEGSTNDDSTPIANPTHLRQLNRLPKLPQSVTYNKQEDENQVADFSYHPARRERPMTMDIDMDIQVRAPEILTQAPGSLIGEGKEKDVREVDSSTMQAPIMSKNLPEAGTPIEKSETPEETHSIDTHLNNDMVNEGNDVLGGAMEKGEKEHHSRNVDMVVPKARRVMATDVGSPIEKADKEKENDSYDIVAGQKNEVVELEPGQEREKEVTNDQIDNVPMIPKAVNSLQIGETLSWEQWKMIKKARKLRRKAHEQWDLSMSDEADF